MHDFVARSLYHVLYMFFLFNIIYSQEMEQSPKNSFLIDGFPRNRDNLDGWNAEMSEVAEVRRVLFFDCPDEVWE